MSASVYPDVNTLTGTLKSYLRDLPDKLFTTEASEAWIAAARTFRQRHGTLERGMPPGFSRGDACFRHGQACRRPKSA